MIFVSEGTKGIVSFERLRIEFLLTKLSLWTTTGGTTIGGGTITGLAGMFCCEGGGELITAWGGGTTAIGLLSLMKTLTLD